MGNKNGVFSNCKKSDRKNKTKIKLDNVAQEFYTTKSIKYWNIGTKLK